MSSRTEALPLQASRSDLAMSFAATAGVGVVMVLVLWLMGRIWWCVCEGAFLWTGEAWSEHTSQHLADPYVFSHVLHGVFFYWLLSWGMLKRRWGWALALAGVLEAGWEIIENTPWVIDRYREATAALGYTGDTIANSSGDFLAALAGFVIARTVGPWGSIGVFVALELGCLWWMRDNLTLNVIMLLFPLESIKQWQSAMGA